MTDERDDISGLADMIPCTPFTVARRRGTAVTPAVADLLTRLAPIPVESSEAPNGATEVPKPREQPAAPLPPGIVQCIARGLRRFQELHPE